MWIIWTTYVLSMLFILGFMYRDGGMWRDPETAASTVVVYTIVAFIPVINTLLVAFMVMMGITGFFMSKATQGITGNRK